MGSALSRVTSYWCLIAAFTSACSEQVVMSLEPDDGRTLSAGQQIPSLEGFPQSDARHHEQIVFEGQTRCLTAAALKDAKIVVVRVEKGGQAIPRILVGPEDYYAASLVMLKGKLTQSNPSIIVLIAQSGVVWDFSRVSRSGLRGVVLLGGAQAISNLPLDVPSVFVNSPAKERACNISRPSSGSVVDDIQRAFDLPVRQVLWKDQPLGISLDDLPYDVVDDGTVRIDNVRTAGRLIATDISPKALGLAELQRNGSIRAATDDDIAKWVRAASIRSGQRRLDFESFDSSFLHYQKSYVALKDFTVPPGLYGGHSVAIFVPDGVQAPTDLGSHTTFYFMKDGSCRGAGAHRCYEAQ